MSPVRPMAVPVRGGDLAIECYGPPAANADATVLLVHDLAADATSWRRLGPRLAPALSVIAVDLRGRGGSTDLPAPFGIAAHVDDLAATLDALAVERVVVVGHATGAFVAVAFAEVHADRVRAAVLIDGGFPEQTAIDPAVDPTRHRFAAAAIDADAADLATVPGPSGGVVRLTVPTELLRAGRGDHGRFMIPLDRADELERRIPLLRVVTVPDADRASILAEPFGVDAVAAAIVRAVRAGPATP